MYPSLHVMSIFEVSPYIIFLSFSGRAFKPNIVPKNPVYLTFQIFKVQSIFEKLANKSPF